MKLKKVEINGFRSIGKMEIEFENGCGHKILVGKNESGKSNILKAMNLLSGKAQFTAQDVKALYKSYPDVQFHFTLEGYEINNCREKFYGTFISKETKALTKNLTIKSFFDHYPKDISYEVDHYDHSETWRFWEFENELNAGGETEIEGNWYQIKSDVVVDPEKGKQFTAGLYIDEDTARRFDKTAHGDWRTFLTKVEDMRQIYGEIQSIISEVAAPEDYKFPVLNWEYTGKENDLPSSIGKTVFIQNPNTCIPLKNMFLLSGYEEEIIGEVLQDAEKVNINTLDNLLREVSEITNKKIKQLWKEYEGVGIDLRSNGNEISISIEDSDSKNRFDFQQRSDGFRRMVSFLLMIIDDIDNDTIDKHIILIDEPETGLHPSSAKNLRDRIIELGKDHIVMYATHSISMIDTENIENNLIVTKEQGNTTYKTAREHGTSPAENVYRAIGYSIYEELEKNNIILEGYSDRKTFNFFMKGNKWKDCSVCYTGGVKNIEFVLSILQLANRKYFVLSDADKPALEKKKKMGNPKWWFT
ncbi:MAG: AAA family ATPase [Candidatus Dadabacteria bacterium]|nr:AAA family ATPase [Candidatus Dadabacteria bacterium]